MTEALHSPLGASSAERWMECAGSVALIEALQLPPSDEPDYQKEGVAAHELAAACLRDGTDAWEHIHETFNDVKVDDGMSAAVQVYLDTVRELAAGDDVNLLIEERVHSALHDKAYGTVDAAVLAPAILDINDYKHGIGIAVDVKENPQLMYYAWLILQQYDAEEREAVRLRIIQPRGFHPDGTIREWTTTREAIFEWAEAVLLPAMRRAEESEAGLLAGKWCRFCPAKMVCPLMRGLFAAAARAETTALPNMTDAELARDYPLVSNVKMYVKAFEEELYRRLNSGRTIPGAKLVNKKANRAWKPEAEAALKEAFSAEELYSTPELKSPAEIDKLGSSGKKLTKEYAFTPQTGLTVVPDDEVRTAVKVESAGERFAHLIPKGQNHE